VPAMEPLGHLLEQVERVEIDAVEVHLDLEDLLAVAHVKTPADADGPVEAGEALAAVALERGEQPPQTRRRHPAHLAHV